MGSVVARDAVPASEENFAELLNESYGSKDRLEGTVVSGTVVGKITASGKYKPVTVAATDGSEDAAGIVMWDVDATSADAPAVIIARDAIVVHQGLKYGADVDTSGERAAIHTALGALNPPILVREGA